MVAIISFWEDFIKQFWDATRSWLVGWTEPRAQTKDQHPSGRKVLGRDSRSLPLTLLTHTFLGWGPGWRIRTTPAAVGGEDNRLRNKFRIPKSRWRDGPSLTNSLELTAAGISVMFKTPGSRAERSTCDEQVGVGTWDTECPAVGEQRGRHCWTLQTYRLITPSLPPETN